MALYCATFADFRCGCIQISIREAKRQNARYRPHAFKSLGRIAAARTDINMADTVFDIVAPVLTDLADSENQDKMDIDTGEGERAEKEL